MRNGLISSDMCCLRFWSWFRNCDIAVLVPGAGKSLLALGSVGPKSEAESVRFHGRRVTKGGPQVKAAAGWLGAAEQMQGASAAAERFKWRTQ